MTCNDNLLGTGQFVREPKQDRDYRRGYLCGMVRGDGTLKVDRLLRAKGGWHDADRFRLALADDEARDRTQRYLNDAGIETTRFPFSRKGSERRSITAIRLQNKAAFRAIESLVSWPDQLTDSWACGFLAGVFDAGGSWSRGILRITNTAHDILTWISSCLASLGFRFLVEPARPNGCRTIRLLGGLSERLRFFHSTDPAVRRKCGVQGLALEPAARLRVVRIQPLDFDMPLFDMRTGTGDFIANGVVSHNCFARPTHAYLNLSPLGDFERTVVVKTNVADVLRRELARPSWKGEHVAMGTNTDPYQRCEGRYRLMPAVIGALADGRTPFSILTKGTLITRDVDVLAAAAAQVPVSAALTVGMLDEALWRDSEPGTPSPAARLESVRRLNDAGVPTGVMLAPIMPGLNDDDMQLAALVDAAAAAGATHITPIVLHLRPGVRELFWPWLEATHPELVDRYTALYRNATAGKAYRDRITASVADAREAAWRRHGRPPTPPSWRGSARADHAPAAEQLRLL